MTADNASSSPTPPNSTSLPPPTSRPSQPSTCAPPTDSALATDPTPTPTPTPIPLKPTLSPTTSMPPVAALPDPSSLPHSEAVPSTLSNSSPNPDPSSLSHASDSPGVDGAVERDVEMVEEPAVVGLRTAVEANGENVVDESRGDMDGVEGAGKDDAEEAAEAVDPPSAPPVEVVEEWWDLQMTWAGKTYPIRVGGNDMVYDFRASIASLTQVPPEGQKLIGLTRSKLNASLDGSRFCTLGVKPGLAKFVMVGTPVDQRFRDPVGPAPVPTDDFDVNYHRSGGKKRTSRRGQGPRRGAVDLAGAEPVGLGGTAVTLGPAPHEDPRNLRQVQKVIEDCPINVMNEPREGKRLLVLDLDYTLVDTKPLVDGALPSIECARPHMHEFLEAVYPDYDIVVWSQTSWRWLETKLSELGVIGADKNYKICFVVDRTPMFPIFGSRQGVPYKHEVKPLSYLWAKFPQWSAKNTIHIDDLSRNFAMNPAEGLRIRAYKSAGQPDSLGDNYLQRLETYLMDIARHHEDFTTLNHDNWKTHSLGGSGKPITAETTTAGTTTEETTTADAMAVDEQPGERPSPPPAGTGNGDGDGTSGASDNDANGGTGQS